MFFVARKDIRKDISKLTDYHVGRKSFALHFITSANVPSDACGLLVLSDRRRISANSSATSVYLAYLYDRGHCERETGFIGQTYLADVEEHAVEKSDVDDSRGGPRHLAVIRQANHPRPRYLNGRRYAVTSQLPLSVLVV